MVCAWDRVRGPRRRPQARRHRRAGPPQPRPRGRGIHRGRAGQRAGGVPRPGRGPDRPGPDPAHPAARHRPRRWTTGRSPGTRPRSSPAPPRCSMTPKPAPPRHKVLDRAARLTPGGLRAAIARAVMEVAPEKAKERRETAAKDARVERWAEDSGNAALMGCELPPDEVLAADQRITAWAQGAAQGRAGRRHGPAPRPRLPGPAAGQGLPSPPRHAAADGGPAAGQARTRRHRPGAGGGAVPAGFAGRVTLTVPLATLTGLADRPGELAGIGPVDPWLARDLAAAAARNPKTTWCVTVTDQARPRHRARLRPARTQEPQETRRTRPARTDRVHLHPGQPGRAARRVRHLAAAHPRTRAGPDHHPGIPDHRPLRPPAPGQRPRPRGQAAAPDPGPARHLHQPRLPAARRPVRRRAQHPVRGRRPDLPVQHRPEVPSRPPAQAAPQVEGRPAPRRHLPLDHPGRTDLHHRTHPVPHLTFSHYR